jgi:hypothetical protein
MPFSPYKNQQKETSFVHCLPHLLPSVNFTFPQDEANNILVFTAQTIKRKDPSASATLPDPSGQWPRSMNNWSTSL